MDSAKQFSFPNALDDYSFGEQCCGESTRAVKGFYVNFECSRLSDIIQFNVVSSMALKSFSYKFIVICHRDV